MRQLKDGQFSYEGKIYSSILDRLKSKGFSVSESKKGDFHNQAYAKVSWENAFTNINEIDLETYPIDNCSLPQLLYITTYRALEKDKHTKTTAKQETTKIQESKKKSIPNKNGTILIVEDRPEEKIGRFQDFLTEQGYTVQIAENFADAEKLLNRLLKTNTIDGIILDFAIPVSEDDKSTTNGNIPNGVVLLKQFLFSLNNRRIPLVINTTADEECKKKYLSELNLEMPIYIVNQEGMPLASPNPSGKMLQEIIDMFNERNKTRKIIPDSKWTSNGGPFIRDSKGNIIGYK